MVREFVIHSGGGGRLWLVPVLFGVALILFGILVMLVPQLLVAMIASLFILLGIGLVGIGLRLRAGGGLGPPPGWGPP